MTFGSLGFDQFLTAEPIYKRSGPILTELPVEQQPVLVNILTRKAPESGTEIFESDTEEEDHELDACCGEAPNWFPYSTQGGSKKCCQTSHKFTVYDSMIKSCCNGRITDIGECQGEDEGIFNHPGLRKYDTQDSFDELIRNSRFRPTSHEMTKDQLNEKRARKGLSRIQNLEAVSSNLDPARDSALSLDDFIAKFGDTDFDLDAPIQSNNDSPMARSFNSGVQEDFNPKLGDSIDADNDFLHDQYASIDRESNSLEKPSQAPKINLFESPNKQDFCLGNMGKSQHELQNICQFRRLKSNKTKFLYPDRTCKFYIECNTVTLRACSHGLKFDGTRCRKLSDQTCGNIFTLQSFGMAFELPDQRDAAKTTSITLNYDDTCRAKNLDFFASKSGSFWSLQTHEYSEFTGFHLDLLALAKPPKSHNRQCQETCGCDSFECQGCTSEKDNCVENCQYGEASGQNLSSLANHRGLAKNYFCQVIKHNLPGKYFWTDWNCKQYIECKLDVMTKKMTAEIKTCALGRIFSELHGYCVRSTTQHARNCGRSLAEYSLRGLYQPTWDREICVF